MDPIRENSEKIGGLVDNSLDSTGHQYLIPTFIFRNRSISVLEAIVKYLKEERRLSFHEIAVILGRDDRNIWTVYNRVRQKNESLKFEHPANIEISDLLLPAAIFLDRRVAVLEAVVVYLKDVSGLKFSEIGMILGRDERTVWTAYTRAKEKRRRNETR